MQLNRGTAVAITYTFVRAGTTTPVPVNSVWTVNDMDGGERTRSSRPAGIAGYAHDARQPGQRVTSDPVDGSIFRGSGTNNGDPASRYQVWFQDKSAISASGAAPAAPASPSTATTTCRSRSRATTTATPRTATRRCWPPTDRTTRHARAFGWVPTRSSTATASRPLAPTATTPTAPTTRTASPRRSSRPPARATTVNVSATNSTATAATLAGWIDLNNNGTFETGERSTVAVPAVVGHGDVPADLPLAHGAGNSYARFRLVPGTPPTRCPPVRPRRGEVEDYPVTFQSGPPILGDCNTAYDLRPGQPGTGGPQLSPVANGTQTVLQPRPVGWGATAGNPGGGLIEDDLDSNYTEMWTPPLVASGYATDYSSYIGKTISFDYKNNTGIGLNVYLGVIGANGSFYWYNFRPQV